MYPLCRDINFVPSDRGMQGKELTINVRNAYRVVVYQIQSSYAASCQSFDSIAAHASKSEYRDAAAGQPFYAFSAIQQRTPDKLSVVIGVISIIIFRLHLPGLLHFTFPHAIMIASKISYIAIRKDIYNVDRRPMEGL